MSTNHRVIDATPDQVFAVLADGWTYPTWVVGAARMRGVDAGWPAVGTRLHHSVGVWPGLLDDTTEVLVVDTGRFLALKARAWPFGAARVELELEPADGGCLVTMRENAVSGPGKLIPAALQDPLLSRRNEESLDRLAFLAEGRDEPRLLPNG